MVIARPVPVLPALALAATLANSVFAPTVAMADEAGRVASIAAKGRIPAIVPVEAGLAFGLGAGLLALAMSRRARRSHG